MSNQLQISGAAKIRSIQGPVVANSGVISALDGDASQYVRGDGTLADFPTSTGGGSSVSYYLNTSVSQGTIGGVAYKQLSKVPISGAGTDVTISANGYIASYLTDANDPALLEVPAGNFNCEFYFSVNSNAHNPYVYAEVYKYDGTTFTLLGSSQSVPEYLTNGTTLSPYYFAIPVATSVLTITDRIAVRIYVNVDGRTVTLHTENNHLCQVVTTFSKGLTTLNSLTRQVQFFQTGTSGTDFAISSSVATHTFNLPVASASNTGKLSSTDWSTFNGKVPYTGANANVDLGLFGLTSNAVKAIGDNSTYGGVISIKQNNVIGGLIGTGYTELFGKTNRLGISFGAGSIAYLSNSVLTAERTYTLPDATGTIALTSNLSSYVPYTGATADVNLGTFDLSAYAVSADILEARLNGTASSPLILRTGTSGFASGLDAISLISSPSSTNTLSIISDVSSVTKRANIGLDSLSATRTYTLPDASGTIALVGGTGVGTVTSVAALTLGTSGTDLSSSVANGTTTPVITLNVPTASATNRGALSSADWTTFNNKQAALTNPVTGTGTSGQVTYFNGTSTVVGSSNHFWDATNNRLGINTSAPIMTLHVNGEIYINNWATFNSTNVNGWYATMQSSGTAFAYLGSTGQFAATGGTATDFGIRSQNAIAFYTNGGNERMRITSTGNVGIGTASPTALLHLSGANTAYRGQLTIQSTDYAQITFYKGATTNTDLNASIFSNITTSEFVIRNNANAAMIFDTNATERMRITSAGRVGIGRTAPGTALSVAGQSEQWQLAVSTDTGAGAVIGSPSANVLAFGDWSGTERMRITSGGNVLMGTTSDDGSIWRLQVATNADVGLRLKSSAGAYTSRIELAAAGGGASVINAQGGTNTLYVSANNTNGVYLVSGGVAWVANSDETLKTDLVAIEDAANKVSSLRSVIGRFKTDEVGTKRPFLIAQDVLKVLPEAVNKNEQTGILGVSYTDVIPLLVAAIKEQQALITSLQSRLDNAGL